MSSLDDNSMAPSLMPSISSQQPTIDLSSQFASHFIDDATVNDYASQFGKHVFNDPYIETIAKDDSTAKIMSDKLVKAKLLKAAAYSTSTVYPSSITETEDWRNMAGIIKKRELMIAFETTNHLRSPQQINLIRSWLEQVSEAKILCIRDVTLHLLNPTRSTGKWPACWERGGCSRWPSAYSTSKLTRTTT